MTRAPSQLQLLPRVPVVDDDVEGEVAQQLTAVEGTGPDGGLRAHPATSIGRAMRSRVDVENEVVGFVCDLLDAPESVVGSVASGTYEAALLVVQAARDARPHVRRPTLVIADSAHPAHLAAADALGVVAVVVPVDRDGRAPVGAMSAAIHQDTVLVVASAPSYTLGLIDPVAWISAATSAREVPLHVDATAGGWALAYAERAGRVSPSWSFAVPGVTSLALGVGPDDGGPTGVTVVLHRTARDRRGLRRVHGWLDELATWLPAAGVLGDTALTLREVGHDGCADLALAGLDALDQLVEGLVDVRGVYVVGRPEGTAITLRTDTTCDVFTLADELHARGWSCEPVLSHGEWPAVLRFPVTAAMLEVVEACLETFGEAVEAAREIGHRELHPSLEKMLAMLHPYDISERQAQRIVEAAGFLDRNTDGVPERVAAMRQLLDVAGPGVREALISARRDLLFKPVRAAVDQDDETSSSTDASE